MWSSLFTFSVAIILINIDGVISRKPELGSVINMFHKYGHLAENIRVFRGNDGPKHIYTGSVVNVCKPRSDSTFTFETFRSFDISAIFLHIHVEFCAHFEDLVKDYFAEFKIAGIDNTSLAFSTNWSKLAIAELFGLTENFIDERYSYIVLKVKRSRASKKLNTPVGRTDFKETVAHKLRFIDIRDIASVEEFIKEFGTHYISSFTTGDLIYQVFVFEPEHFRHLKNEISSKTIYGLGDIERNTMFSSQQAVKVGPILSASGSQALETWAAENLNGQHTTDTGNYYPSLIRLFLNGKLCQHLDRHFKNLAVFGMELESMSSLCDSSERRQILDEYIRQRLKTVGAH